MAEVKAKGASTKNFIKILKKCIPLSTFADVVKIEIPGNKLDARGMALLESVLEYTTNLRSLNLSSSLHPLNISNICRICAALPKLEYLNLSDSKLVEQDSEYLAKYLRNTVSLKVLCLQQNNLGAGARILASGILENTRSPVMRVFLWDNSIPDSLTAKLNLVKQFLLDAPPPRTNPPTSPSSSLPEINLGSKFENDFFEKTATRNFIVELCPTSADTKIRLSVSEKLRLISMPPMPDNNYASQHAANKSFIRPLVPR